MTVPCVANDADHQSLEWLSGHPVKVLLDSAATGGQLMMLESTPHAGSASPLHVHGREDEMFLLLAGAVLVVVGEQRYELGKGGVAFLPREVLHAYRITRDAHLQTLTTPGGLEEFFRTAGPTWLPRSRTGGDGSLSGLFGSLLGGGDDVPGVVSPHQRLVPSDLDLDLGDHAVAVGHLGQPLPAAASVGHRQGEGVALTVFEPGGLLPVGSGDHTVHGGPHFAKVDVLECHAVGP